MTRIVTAFSSRPGSYGSAILPRMMVEPFGGIEAIASSNTVHPHDGATSTIVALEPESLTTSISKVILSPPRCFPSQYHILHQTNRILQIDRFVRNSRIDAFNFGGATDRLFAGIPCGPTHEKHRRKYRDGHDNSWTTNSLECHENTIANMRFANCNTAPL